MGIEIAVVEFLKQNDIFKLDRIEKELGIAQSTLYKAKSGRGLTAENARKVFEYLSKKNINIFVQEFGR